MLAAAVNTSPAAPVDPLRGYLSACRGLVLKRLQEMVPDDDTYGPILYDLAMEYPRRGAKLLRPAICIAICRVLGGDLDAALPSAAVLELYHNAFLLHDDVEDDSEMRRGAPCLHRTHGRAVAINVGDAMLALAMEPLLDNCEGLGVGAAMRVLRIVARMSRESAEGQALELDWIRRGEWGLEEEDYLEMVHKKTSWYTFLAPAQIGAAAAGIRAESAGWLEGFATHLGAAFQIQDDLINLQGDVESMGKEAAGDLWEGKRTLILLHALRRCGLVERRRAHAILALPRDEKRAEDIAFLMDLIRRQGSMEYAARFAAHHAGIARACLDAALGEMPPSTHRAFLEALVDFVIERAV